jgi:hypothetical protein
MKKLYFSILFSLCFSASQAQTTINWNVPLTVASGSTYSNIYPRITLMTGDKPLVVWESDATDKVYRSKYNGTSFSMPMPVNPAGVTPFVANWAGAEVASSGDTAFVVFTSMPAMTGKAYIVRSIDGGVTFGDTVRVDPNGTMDIPRFAAVAVAPGGNPVVNYMQINSSMTDAEYAVARSTNGGSSFSAPNVASAGAPGFVCDCCPGTMVINGDNQALLYRNADMNIRDIWGSFSSDASLTFPASAEIDETGWYITSCPSSGPSGVIIGDSLFYSWMSDATGDARIYIGSVNINDQQIGQSRQIFPVGTNTQNYPVIAGKGDTLGVVWQGYSSGTQEVFFSYSVTGLAGLGTKVDTLTKTFSGNQFRPDLSYSNGKFHIVYSDNTGTGVKYLAGSINTVLGIEDYSNNSFTITYSSHNNEIGLSINSKVRTNAVCEVLNSIGQRVYLTSLQINTGNNVFAIPSDFQNGLYYINVISSNGIGVTSKIVLLK